MLSNLTRNTIQNSLKGGTAFYLSLSSRIVSNTVPGPEKMLRECMLDE